MDYPGQQDDSEAPDLRPLLQALHALGGQDFSLYRESTLRRRIDRRMRIHGIRGIHDYLRLLERNPQEVSLLSRELLIGVTQFFRDTPIWEFLAQSTLRALLKSCPADRPLRLWSAGCSTGEEAYSLSIIYREICEQHPGEDMPGLQILATDLSDEAIVRARQGIFPVSIAGEMSPDRLGRFFHSHPDGFRIDQSVRDHVVFARHDLLSDPPFTRIDMISCRNLLIYLVEGLQQRLMQVFHFSLRPGGVLLLGSSESVGGREDLFETIDARLRLFRRRMVSPQPKFHQLLRAAQPRSSSIKDVAVTDTTDKSPDLQTHAERLLLSEYAPPAAVVNERGDVLNILGHTGRFLEPAAGKANWNLHAMARPRLRDAINRVLKAVSEGGLAAEQSGWLIDAQQQRQAVRVSAQLLDPTTGTRSPILVVFRPIDRVVIPAESAAEFDERRDDLERDLHLARQETLGLHVEMRRSREELQAANEELQASNEELQSTNEELTSSKEELQSMNEELRALNAELQSRLSELALAQSDMRNLLTGLDVATVFLDASLRVRRFTEHTRRIFRLRDNDIGRSVDELSGSLDYPDLQQDVREVLRTLVVCERAVSARDGRWYAVRIGPYRDGDDRVQGAVLTFLDITATKLLESRLRGG